VLAVLAGVAKLLTFVNSNCLNKSFYTTVVTRITDGISRDFFFFKNLYFYFNLPIYFFQYLTNTSWRNKAHFVYYI
jgi:hypothetical protein